MTYGGWTSLADKRADEAHKAALAATEALQGATNALQGRTSREQRRYEIAKDVLAAMVGANVYTQTVADGESISWPDSGTAEARTYPAMAVTFADALLAALEEK